MFNISSYLEKFKKIDFGDMALKQMLIDAMKISVGISIDLKQLKIQNGIVYIKADPLLKNQIVIKKQALLSTILQKTDKIKDIR